MKKLEEGAKRKAKDARQKEFADRISHQARMAEILDALVTYARIKGINVALDCINSTIEQQGGEHVVPGAIMQFLSDEQNVMTYQQNLDFNLQGNELYSTLLTLITHDSLIACLVRTFEGLRQVLKNNRDELKFIADYDIVNLIRQNIVHHTFLADDHTEELLKDALHITQYFQPLIQNIIERDLSKDHPKLTVKEFKELFVHKFMGKDQENNAGFGKEDRLKHTVKLCNRLTIYADIAKLIERKHSQSYYTTNPLHQAMSSLVEQIGEQIKQLKLQHIFFKKSHSQLFINARNKLDHQFSEERRAQVPHSELAVFEPIAPSLLYGHAEHTKAIVASCINHLRKLKKTPRDCGFWKPQKTQQGNITSSTTTLQYKR